MKGDFSRGTFDPQKHYAGVLMQQGRVQVDADWNEQLAIAAHRTATEARDVIGACGAPIHDAGFGITLDGNDLRISGGRYYVDGILCENERKEGILFRQQPDLPNPPDWIDSLNKANTTFGLVYLDVWQRHLTALDDSRLREVALGGPDTTTRIKTVWQVKLLPVQVVQFSADEFLAFLKDFATILQKAADAAQSPDLKANLAALAKQVQEVVAQPDKFKKQLEEEPEESKAGLQEFLDKLTAVAPQANNNPQLNAAIKKFAGFVDRYSNPVVISCDTSFPEWNSLIAPSTGRLNARTVTPPASDDPCLIPPSAGYRSLENQLYRLEIHNASQASGGATFKWSRDNGSVVTLIEQISGKEVTVRDTGPDDLLGFASGQWVEISDDSLELNNLPGQLVQIDKVNSATRVITLKSAATPLAANADGVDKTGHPKLRRWDQSGANATDKGIPVTAGWIALEQGIEVQFNGTSFHTGDYWQIPARTATGEIEWPPFAIPNDNPLPQPPLGIQHHFCRLALLQLNDQRWTVTDCRDLFPPLSEITCCSTNALHVTATNWHNDDFFSSPAFVRNGLRITLDAAPDPNSVNHNSVIVTVETPFQPNANNNANTLLQTIIVPGTVGIDPNDPRVIVWKLTETERRTDRLRPSLSDLVNRPPIPLRPLGQDTPNLGIALAAVATRQTAPRVHVTLKGHILWREERRTRQASRHYLDGQAFGEPALRSDQKTPRTALHFPTGNGAKASDFESWFFVGNPPAEPLQVTSVVFRNANLQQVGNPITPPVDPATKIQFNEREGVQFIELTFSRAVQPGSLDQPPGQPQSLRVDVMKGNEVVGRVFGPIKQVSDNVAQFMAQDPRFFSNNPYRLTVFGNDEEGGPAIHAADNNDNLDGDFDNQAGGNFVLAFDSLRQIG